MARSKGDPTENSPAEVLPVRLREAVHQARTEQADRTGVIVDLRDAESARLDLLNEALDPVFAEIPDPIDLFDRGLARGDTPRLWIDVVAHVAMARDKRTYRFVQDTRVGRKVLAQSPDIEPIVEAVTRYVARRMVERERALTGDETAIIETGMRGKKRQILRAIAIFLLGMVCGIALLFFAAYIVASSLPVR